MKQVIYAGRNTPQCNICNQETNVTLMQAVTLMNKDFSTKETKATFFCNHHKGQFTIIGNKKIFHYE